MSLLTKRWEQLRPHPNGEAYSRSQHRFNVIPAGRRSGKTERFKRKLVTKAMMAVRTGARFFAGAPTRDQAKRIFWDDLKALVPDWMKRGKPSESELCIQMVNGASIWVLGMDRPERIEGQPWDGGGLDEYGNMKPEAWGQNVRPALSDREGWCDLFGVPEGRNHYYDLDKMAQAELAEHGDASEWGRFTWKSSEVLPATEIEAARRDLDELTFQQEYEASFVNFVGRAYYSFLESTHTCRLTYDPKGALIVCLDFNVEPGVAVMAQEQVLPGGAHGTGVIGEVWIPRNSNTPAVCRKIAADWDKHTGPVRVYGDATGGARGSAQVLGSDWDLAKSALRTAFGGRVSFHVPSANPAERARLNAMNSRILSMDGTIRLMVDPARAPHVVKDLEGVRLLAGGSGEIDKRSDPELTHLTDALGYYVEHEFPLQRNTASVRIVHM